MNELLDSLGQSDGTGAITPIDVALHLLLAFLMGQLVAWIYVWTHRGVTYSRSHVHALVLLCLIVTTVMLAIGGSLARAFGLFGALALIRFRTPVKDTRDTIFLFLAVGIGVCIGTRNMALGVLGGGFALLVAIYLTFSRFGERTEAESVLRFQLPAAERDENVLRSILKQHCRSFSLMHLREVSDETLEFAYRVRLEDAGFADDLLLALHGVDGIRGTSLFVQSEEEEV